MDEFITLPKSLFPSKYFLDICYSPGNSCTHLILEVTLNMCLDYSVSKMTGLKGW